MEAGTYDEEMTDLDDATELDDKRVSMLDAISAPNLVPMLSPGDVAKIGADAVAEYAVDLASCTDFHALYDRAMDTAMQVRKEKTWPWPKSSNVIFPLLTTAAVQFNARAMPAIIDGQAVVKGRVLGPDPDGTKRAKADRIGQHMTWQLLYRMPGWDEGTDKLLLTLPIVGNMFRKVWYDSIENANRSEIVSADDFIINNDAKSIETAPRYTQVLHYYPYEVQELVAAGLWREVPIDDSPEDGDGNDAQGLGDYYEQHRCLDLDQDGYPEHYVVTTTKEGNVARIVPCFGLEDITASLIGPDGKVAKTEKLSKIMEAGEENPQVWEIVGDIVKIERRQYFTKYGFIPAPDGSFYDIGFGDLLENVTGLIDTLQNQMLDAATLQNAQGGFLGSGVNVRGGSFKFASVGEWKRVDTQGGTLRDNIMPLSLPGPSAVSFSLLELLMQAAKDIASAQDVVAGRSGEHLDGRDGGCGGAGDGVPLADEFDAGVHGGDSDRTLQDGGGDVYPEHARVDRALGHVKS